MDPSDARRELAARLAAILKSEPQALPILQLLSDGGSFAMPPGNWVEDTAPIAPGGPPRIGIWQLDEATGDFVRGKEHVDMWRFCADVERIPRKGKAKRVLFLGESVARGYFYDPLYSPAKALGEILGSDFEIVDLAQSNSSPEWLCEVAASAHLLSPDAIVVFAGNNWFGPPFQNFSADHFVEARFITEDGGYEALLTEQRKRLESVAVGAMTSLTESAKRAGAPLIFVAPEINVADWSMSPRESSSLLLMSERDTKLWIDAHARAVDAFARGELDAAETAASEAVALDHGTSPSSLELLARIQQRRGRLREAYATAYRVREICILLPLIMIPAPGILPNVRAAVGRIANETGTALVSLPEVLGEVASGELPGRRHFFDYCHLTSEGIRVAMAAVAERLNAALGRPAVAIADLVAAASKPTPEQEAWAHLLAGIHNAHYAQPIELCTHHFSRALVHHAPIIDALRTVFDTFRHGIAPNLTAAYDALVRTPIAERYLVGYGLGFAPRSSEYNLLRSIVGACPSIDEVSIDPKSALGVAKSVDLAAFAHRPVSDKNLLLQRAFIAEYGVSTVVSFVCSEPATLRVDLTHRVPEARESGPLSVRLNGHEIGQPIAGATWQSSSVIVEAARVRRGVNELTLTWPNVGRADAREACRRNFELGRVADPLTHFGQLHTLRVSLGTP